MPDMCVRERGREKRSEWKKKVMARALRRFNSLLTRIATARVAQPHPVWWFNTFSILVESAASASPGYVVSVSASPRRGGREGCRVECGYRGLRVFGSICLCTYAKELWRLGPSSRWLCLHSVLWLHPDSISTLSCASSQRMARGFETTGCVSGGMEQISKE